MRRYNDVLQALPRVISKKINPLFFPPIPVGKHPGPRCQQCRMDILAFQNILQLQGGTRSSSSHWPWPQHIMNLSARHTVLCMVVIWEIAHVITGTVAVNKVIHIALKEHIRPESRPLKAMVPLYRSGRRKNRVDGMPGTHAGTTTRTLPMWSTCSRLISSARGVNSSQT